MSTQIGVHMTSNLNKYSAIEAQSSGQSVFGLQNSNPCGQGQIAVVFLFTFKMCTQIAPLKISCQIGIVMCHLSAMIPAGLSLSVSNEHMRVFVVTEIIRVECTLLLEIGLQNFDIITKLNPQAFEQKSRKAALI